MKSIILILTIFLFTTNTDNFCKGWEKGYIDGYCYRVEGCIKPILPLCPLPEIDETTYKDGYQRGFLEGRENNNL